MTTLAVARAHGAMVNRRHTGLTQRTRQALKAGPASADELALQLGCPRKNVNNALQLMVARNQAVPIGGRPYRYALPNSEAAKAVPQPCVPRKRSGSGVIAGPKMVRGYLW
jgi:biotin operon repressor